MAAALDHYQHILGFKVDWGGADGGIAGISNGHCRMFLTDAGFRAQYGWGDRNPTSDSLWGLLRAA